MWIIRSSDQAIERGEKEQSDPNITGQNELHPASRSVITNSSCAAKLCSNPLIYFNILGNVAKMLHKISGIFPLNESARKLLRAPTRFPEEPQKGSQTLRLIRKPLAAVEMSLVEKYKFLSRVNCPSLSFCSEPE